MIADELVSIKVNDHVMVIMDTTNTTQRLTFCQDSYHVIERLKSVICQMFLMLSGGVMR